MQTAIQSYKDAIENIENKHSQEFNKVRNEIYASINDGKFYVFKHGELSEFVIHKLTKLGYNAKNETYDDGNNYYWISWYTDDVCSDDYKNESKIYSEINSQMAKIKAAFKRRKRDAIIYSFIGGAVGYYISKLIFYLLTSV